MRLVTQLIFDDFIVGTTPIVTSPAFEELLGTFDRLRCQLVADTSRGLSKLAGRFQHTTDRRNYLDATVGADFIVVVQEGITRVLDITAPPIVFLPFVRISMKLDDPIIARVKLWATGRVP